MPYSKLQIYNLACGVAGTRTNIASLTEASREREVCDLYYPIVRDTVLKAAHWSCAKAYERLALLSERDTSLAWAAGDPAPNWLYAYALPASCLYPRNLSDWTAFELGRVGTTRAVMTNTPQALLEYTVIEEDVALWDEMLVYAVFHGLGAYVTRQLTGKAQRAEAALRDANTAIQQARVNNANLGNFQAETLAPWHAERGVGPFPGTSRFIYPYGSLLAMGLDVGTTN